MEFSNSPQRSRDIALGYLDLRHAGLHSTMGDLASLLLNFGITHFNNFIIDYK
jgi:hypothetical protein